MSCHDTETAQLSGSTATLTREASAPRIALVGNPNAGKSTLFNALTGMRAKVANYPGVTVTRTTGTIAVDGETLTLEDLPGTYSLDAISPDEQIVTDSLTQDNPPQAILAVLDATTLRRSLAFLAQMQNTGLPALVVLTCADELARRSGTLDAQALSRALGMEVRLVTAGNKAQADHLRADLAHPEQWKRPAIPAPLEPTAVTTWVESILRKANYHAPQADDRTRKLDSVLIHPVWGSIIFFTTMFVFFQVIFTAATPAMDAIEAFFSWLAEVASGGITTPWLRGLVADGLIGGVGGVVVFLPQIVLLFFMISLLEASGYLSRAAYLMDRVMSKAGLEGRAFVAMLSALACAIPGIMATRSLPSARDRLATMLSAPLMTCSARLPVYTMLIAMLVPSIHWGPIGIQGAILFALYLLGAMSAMGSAWLTSKLLSRSTAAAPFFMEMPSYRIPSWRDFATGIWRPVKGFLSKVGRVILLLTVVLWALLNLPAAGPAELASAGIDPANEAAVAAYQLDHSYAASIGKAVQPIFEPLGFDWRVTVGVLGSLGAREVFVSTMGQIAHAENPDDPQATLEAMTWTTGPHAGELVFTAPTIVALMVFFVFALQCTSTIAVLRKESGSWKWPLLAFVGLFALAWSAAFIAHTLTALVI